MPNPKRKLSRSRRDSRRATYKAPTMTIAKDTTTGKLYYKGKVVMEKASKA